MKEQSNDLYDGTFLYDEGQISSSVSASSALINKKNIIFIDTQVPDYENLIANIQPGTEVVILDPRKDGIAQITESLLGKQYDSLHIVSHGSTGSLQLGSNYLNSGNLSQYQNQLQQWKAALTEEADILLYGCDVAAGETGVAFVQQLSQFTGADVAASNNLTGSAALGGDWDLEVKTGSIEAPLAFSSNIQESFASVLNTPVVGDVIINEFSQGENSGKEWVEILVVKDNLNLQGVRLADGTESLDLTLSGGGFASLKAGTLIVIYNGNDVDSKITPDLNYNSASGDYTLQIASNNNSGTYAVNPTIPGSGWNTNGTFTNSDNSDIPRLLNAEINGGQELHRFARTTTPGSGQFSQYIRNSASGATISVNWSANSTSTNATPGAGNPGDNLDWVNILRGVVKVVNTPAVIINNPSPASNELFGFSLASSSNNILIGAPKAGGNKGEAYRFGINGSFQQPFTNPSSNTLDQFGFAVATDGTNYLIGATKFDGTVQDIGIAYRFDASGIKQETFNNSVNNDDSEFGSAITILSNGNYVISAPEKGKNTATDNAGQVSLFSSNGTLLKDIINPETGIIQDARFGFSIASAVNNIFIGSPGFTSGTNFGAGKAYLYNTTSDIFVNFTNPNASLQDFFGFSVASNSDGTRFLVGAPGETIGGTAGIAYLFDNNSSLLRTFTNSDTSNQGFGASVAFVGNDILIGSPGGFTLNSTTGTFDPTPNSGAVYLYDGDGTTPTYNLDSIFTNPGTDNDGFGAAISVINDNRIAISSPYYDAASNTDAGIAYLFNINNTLPTASNKTITINEDVTYIFSATDFNFVDADGDNLQKVKFTNITGLGTFTLNGDAIAVNQEINIADINNGNLKFIPIGDDNDSNYASLQFQVNDGVDFSALSYEMTIDVNPINDAPTFTIGGNQSVRAISDSTVTKTIEGWAYNFNSGAANETQENNGYTVTFVNSLLDSSFLTGIPTINTTTGDLTYTLADNITGTGSKTIGFTVTVQDSGGAISEAKNFNLTVTSGAINFVTTDPITNNIVSPTTDDNTLMGSDGNDRIDGLAGSDTIYGGLGNDRIIGGAGNDILYGDLGNLATIPSYALANGITFDDIIQGNAGNDTIYGGWGNDKLYGNAGDDILWGGDGDDILWGVAGKDTFVLDSATIGKDTIQDFKLGEDQFSFAGSLGYSALTFVQQGSDILIKAESGSLDLALVKNITQANIAQSSNFLSI